MKKLITENEIIKLFNAGQKSLITGKDTLFTPAALDKIKEYGITVSNPSAENAAPAKKSSILAKTIVLGNDHNGYQFKKLLMEHLHKKGYQCIDAGSYDTKPADFPEIARRVCLKIKNGEAGFGIITDATGNASAMVCNKFRNIRAATGYNEFTARSSREHNNANVLCLGAKALGDNSLLSIVDAWLTTEFGGGRHQKRLDIVSEIESVNFK